MRTNNTDNSAQSHALQEKGRVQLFGKKKLILGVSRTGAKFTPKNHKDTGDRVFDAINSGDLIDVERERIKAELKALKSLDVRYVHEHARNPITHEQSADTSLYQSFSKLARTVDPSAMLSFGASRNGTEISAAIKDGGELARTRHAGLSIADGGAEFVTSQAAIELQIVTDLERQGFVQIDHASGDWKLLRDLKEYVPSGSIEGAKLEVHSTTGGGNYGASSASVQMGTLNWSIARRRELGLPFEVEWVQHGRSSLLTWLLIHGFEDGLGSVGRLNITILFGFSPRLPFPKRYADFKRVVDAAHSVSLARNGQDRVRLKVSVSVGAAVLPQHALEQVCAMDVGPMKGQVLQSVDRLTGYAAMPDSGVDILRVGMEDTPYMVDRARNVVPTTNSQLAERARGLLETCGASVVTNARVLKGFSHI